LSKVSITGNASGSGTFTLAAPNSNSDRTLTLPDNTGTIVTTGTTTGISASAISTGTLAAARLPAGSVLQVLQAVKTDVFSVNGNESAMVFSDITGLSVSITPASASNKILVFGDVLTGVAVNGEASIRLIRGSTSIYIGGADGSRTRATGAAAYDNDDSEVFYRQTFIYLDSPATTNSTTYKVQLGAYNNVANYVNRVASEGAGAETTRGASSITVMEIAG
jgi:hypothetical protein